MDSFGTDEAIRRIVEQCSPMLLRAAYARLGSVADAEDAVQETFLRLLTACPRFRDAEHEKAWLIRVTLQRAGDIRRAAERKNAPLEEDTVQQTMPERDHQLLSAVQALPEKYGAVIHFYYYEGYSIREIAKLLGLPPPTVGTRLARGRARLKELLKEDVL